MAYAVGHISGCHLNPAVSFGLWAGKRFPTADLIPYIIAQVLGAVAGAFVIYLIATGKAGFDVVQSGFAANGYGDHSPGGYSLFAALVCEIVMTYMFLIVILGSTHGRAPVGFAGIAIGLALTLIHLISIPVTNTSVNPARSTGPAIFVGGWAPPSFAFGWRQSLAQSRRGGLTSGLVRKSERALCHGKAGSGDHCHSIEQFASDAK
jgi:aquaporin Z